MCCIARTCRHWSFPRRTSLAAVGGAKFKRIVCGVNLHLSSLEALRFALSLATESDAELRVVSVLEPLAAVLPLGTPTHVIAEHRERQRQMSLRGVRQHVPDEARQACTIREEAYIGEPVGTLLQVAQEATPSC